MFKSALVVFATLASATSFAAGIDFAKVPQDSLVICNGLDGLNSDQTTKFGVTSIYSPNLPLVGRANYAHIVSNLADPTQSIQAATIVQKVETLADAAAVKAFLTAYLGQTVNPAAIDDLSAGEANYPMTAVVGMAIQPDDKGQPAQLDVTLNIYGWTDKQTDGSVIEYGMSIYMIAGVITATPTPAPSVTVAALTQQTPTQQTKAPETPAPATPSFAVPDLASYSFNTCELAKIADVFAPSEPVKAQPQTKTEQTTNEATQQTKSQTSSTPAS